MKSYDNHDLIWTCASCGKKNIAPMHTDPEAHFPSLDCEFCGEETDDCPCDRGAIVPAEGGSITISLEQFRRWGAIGGSRTKGKGGPTKRRGDSEYYRRLAARRKQKNRNATKGGDKK